jgi:hypothetical protein
VRNRDCHVERLNKGEPHVNVGASFLEAEQDRFPGGGDCRWFNNRVR